MKVKEMDDFLVEALSGIDANSASKVIYREDLVELFEEDSNAVKDFDCAFSLIKSGVKNYTRDLGDYSVNYELSIEGESIKVVGELV